MQTYAAVDLHSNNGFLAIIDETDRVLRQRKLPNKLELFVSELEPYRSTLQGVAVESTFNWYWLVDGLQRKEFPVVLVNTSAIQQYSGLKHSDDEYDAWWLAHMMRLGILPQGYIYPREQRAVRDLLRKRATLVRQRTANILSVQNLEQRNRGTKISSNEVKRLTEASISAVYDNEDLALALTTTINGSLGFTPPMRDATPWRESTLSTSSEWKIPLRCVESANRSKEWGHTFDLHCRTGNRSSDPSHPAATIRPE
jgi:transposase